MDAMLTIAKRELTSFFYSPIAYVVMATFALLSGFLFFNAFSPGEASSSVMRYTFGSLVQLAIFLVPALSMRMIAEEFRTGTIEPLMTAPVTDTQVVLGKWLGAAGFYAVMLLVPMLVLLGLVLWHSDPGYGQIFTGLLGLLLVGGLYLAVGTFTSATTQNQIVAWILAVLVICVFTFLMDYLYTAAWMSNELREVIAYLNINEQASDFSKGLIAASSVLYFVSAICLFLFMAVKALESRRWR